MGLFDDIFGKNVKQRQEPLQTQEEIEARRFLNRFVQEGRVGQPGAAITAGEDLRLPFGVFEPTDIEKTGLENLSNIVSAGSPEELDLGTSALKSLLATSAEDAQARFDPFKAQTLREIQEAEDRLKRGSAFAGNLFGSKTIEGLGDVQARGTEVLASKLAQLANEAQERQFRAIPLAADIARTREDINIGRVDASQRFGSLERLLESARLDSERQEALRRRGEVFSRLDVAGGIRSPEFGVREVETFVPSPFSNLLDIAARTGGQVAAARAGRPSAPK